MTKSTKANFSVETITSTEISIKKFTISQSPLSLILDKVISTYEIVREVNTEGYVLRNLSKQKLIEVVEKLNLPLEEINAEELACLRKDEHPIFVLKQGLKLFYSLLPNDVKSIQISFSCHHMCASCERLSAASDANGGCAKVRNRKARIEYFPWISGCQVTGTLHKSFIVSDCQQYEKYRCRKRISSQEKMKRKAAISEYFHPDIIISSI